MEGNDPGDEANDGIPWILKCREQIEEGIFLSNALTMLSYSQKARVDSNHRTLEVSRFFASARNIVARTQC